MASRADQHSSRPVVGVTGSAQWWSPSWFCIRLAVWLAGGRARRITIRHSWPMDSIDALIVSGGDDIHPSLYGAEEMPRAQYDQARDALEQTHIDWALKHRLPMLGICRGTQLINVCLGGSLHTDIRARRKRTSNRGTVLPRKTAEVEGNSRLLAALQAGRLRINSLHHQAVDRLGAGVRVVALDLDGFVQGIEPVGDACWLGVQWHPEYLLYRPQHLRLFRWLVQQCMQKPVGPPA
ncbi:MAG TPA: gamma-glutamyl-gamma-aminobutyrate hydrolase family protein [Limnobacter sp.]|nr:gamma-glutamyl-gamma-aminobutyrate hydrolase family protein [Limnobacter sp.]